MLMPDVRFIIPPGNDVSSAALFWDYGMADAMLIVPGLGLTLQTPLYHSMAALMHDVNPCIASTSAAGYISFANGFRNPKGWSFHSVDDVSREFVNHVKHLSSGHRRVHVLAHSWGALIALHALDAHPQIASLILVSPVLSTSDILTVNLGSGTVIGEEAGDPWVRTIESAPLPFMSRTVIRELQSRPLRLSTLLEGLRPRGLITVGEKENPHLVAATKRMMEAFPALELFIVPGAGHFYGGRERSLIEKVRAWLQ